MAAAIVKLMLFVCLTLPLLVAAAPSPVGNEGGSNLLDVETPNFFSYNSPLRQPGSLQSRPYYDFLSTLYRRDATKTDLFRPRSRRDTSANAVQHTRSKRAIVFRPLFVYRQQEIKKQQINAQKRV